MAIGLISDTLMHTPCYTSRILPAFYIVNSVKIQLLNLRAKIKNTVAQYSMEQRFFVRRSPNYNHDFCVYFDQNNRLDT
ncbi:hypothetical protein CDG60_06500 [Acinetobacter chinensis]|uniref:Uncharacterized protein n=1 Tax=Acinetobacter chinensis TaxID=2004650 RepID=A0A3B7LV31_9GAMM|nr:hypothetical protein CDG60_06500 [Acinetobacter chinensis]AXY59640.1 hypothetical protein CDG61_06130 [Acinetobacter sp. WCHAc010052]